MKLNYLVRLMPRFTLSYIIALTTSLGCRDRSVDLVQNDPPTQRVVASTKLYLGTYPDLISSDTVIVEGVVYPVNALDSLSFYYDNQQRPIQLKRTQISQAYGKKTNSPTVSSTYSYQNGQMNERENFYETYSGRAFQFPLDSTQRRVIAYTKSNYSFVDFDSLRHYSIEGILLSASRSSYNPSYPDINRRLPTMKTTVEAGNIIRSESYNSWSGAIEAVTRFVYDNKHHAPLATFTFLGETSRNTLLRKTVIGYYGNQTITHEYMYTNEYDSQGRLTRQLESEVPKSSTQRATQTLTKFYY